MAGPEAANLNWLIALIAFATGAVLVTGIAFGWFAKPTPARPKERAER